MKFDTPTKIAKSVPSEIIDILGPPPLLSTEESKVYYAMLGYLANDIPPDDMITWLLLKDLVDHRIEMARYRRLKGALLQKVHNVRVQRNIAQLRTNLDAELKALRTQADRDCESLRRDVHDLQERQKKMGEVTAHLEAKLAATNEAYSQAIRRWEQHRATEQDLVNGLDDWIHDHQKIDRLLEIAERRFIVTRRELEQHISGFRKELRSKFQKVIDGDVIEAETQAA